MNRKKKRSNCPIASTLDILGDKWTLIIIRDLLEGKSHFKEFCESSEKIATNILSSRLNKLLRYKIIKTMPSPLYPGRSAYHLTDRGYSLKDLVKSFSNWGIKHIPGTH